MPNFVTESGIQPPDCTLAERLRGGGLLLARLDHGAHPCFALAVLLLSRGGPEQEPREEERDQADEDADDDLCGLDRQREHQAPLGSSANSSGST